MPERARRQANNLISALKKKNISPILLSSLKNYLDELGKGFDFEITYLDDDMAIIRAERDADTDKIWCEAGLETALNNLSDIHDEIQKYYPLDLEREEFIENAPIDSSKFDDDEYRKNLEQLVENTQLAFEEGKVTQEYLDAVERQKRQYIDIATLYPVPIIEITSDEDRVIPEKIKKRHLYQNVGFAGKSLSMSHKVVGIGAGIVKIFEFLMAAFK